MRGRARRDYSGAPRGGPDPRGGEGDMGGAPRQQYQNAPRSNNYGQSRPAQNYNPPPMPPTNQPSNDFGDMDDEIPF